MFAQNRRHDGAPPDRRGVVLVLILGMLALLALIGVTFASIAGQAQTHNRKFAESLLVPAPEEMFDYALSQLINDTTNPLSALHGHGLLRDMYGNDAASNGVSTNLADGSYLLINQVILNANGSYQVSTNIPARGANTNSPSYDFNPIGWTLRIPSYTDTTNVFHVARTFEIQAADDSGGYFVFQLAPGANAVRDNANGFIAQPFTGAQFTLDSRGRNAFNGTGVESIAAAYAASGDPIAPLLRLPNFLYNQLSTTPPLPALDLGSLAMDEDYDACDLENMFLALQSADGSVMIPSFHRPGIMRFQTDTAGNILLDDWRNVNNLDATIDPDSALLRDRKMRARFLRPRLVDHPTSGLKDLVPVGHPRNPNPYDPTTQPVDFARVEGTLEYDVDNDGDGKTDSVWVDLGFPARRDASGRLYKPMFAFMILGTNGRMPLNTSGNLQARTLLTLGPDGLPNSGDEAGAAAYTYPIWDHTSHQGFTVNEINPKYGLQNGGGGPQFDDAGVAVNTTQLRNLLAGTKALDPTTPLTDNGDRNTVMVNGSPFTFSNNIADPNDIPSSTYMGIIDRLTTPIPGIWGEPQGIPSQLASADYVVTPVTLAGPPSTTWNGLSLPLGTFRAYNSRVGPGRSATAYLDTLTNPPTVKYYLNVDGTNDSFLALDFSGQPIPATNPVRYDFETNFALSLDAAGHMVLPSERFRMFLTPMDVSGNGAIARWNTLPTNIASDTGPDRWGRVSHYLHFRPAGVPAYNFNVNAKAIPPDANANGVPDEPLYTFRHNLYHGYEAFRNPKDPGAGNQHRLMSAMPYNLSEQATAANQYKPTGYGTQPRYLYDVTDPAKPAYVGTFDTDVNSVRPGPNSYQDFAPADLFGYYTIGNGSLGRELANEVNFYRPNVSDQPFGYSDLEWLYRQQDVDGITLDSRLKRLAAISFVGSPDALTRRRLYSVEAWDTNRFSWAHDNPGNAFPNNSWFTVASSANTINAASVAVQPALSNIDFTTQPVLNRSRRINLNVPLVLSNDPAEPGRRKWITETYETLKQILPPKSVDTPEELLALSQYVVNIIDFRDTDAACTKFTNPDVWIEEGVIDDPTGMAPVTPQPPRLHMRTKWDTVTSTWIADPKFSDIATGHAAVQWGMEFSPIAINEVLAYQFNRKRSGTDETNVATRRLWIEFANLLSRDSGNAGSFGTDLELDGWEIRILPDDARGRPDPFNGQIATNQPKREATGKDDHWGPLDASNTKFAKLDDIKARGLEVNSDGTADNPDGAGTNYFLVVKTPDPAGLPRAIEANVPTATALPTNPLDSHDSNPASTTAPPDIVPGKYYWLYLLRPSNPLVPTSEKVVVDSIRFPYTASNTVGQEDSADNINNPKNVKVNGAAPNQEMYSTSRFQPYRGGQLVPTVPPYDMANPAPGRADYRYGYSEQCFYPQATSANAFAMYAYYSNYSQAVPTTPPPAGSSAASVAMTMPIYSSLGSANTLDASSEDWNLFPFHDRDFISVAELELVPGCPPGLFTKQFVERVLTAPPADLPVKVTVGGTDVSFPLITPPLNDPTGAPAEGTRIDPQTPVVYPYLPDQFHYTADGRSTTTADNNYSALVPGVPAVGGTTNAGWHKMFELFEVPSTAMGAIGPVANGENFDWYREDLRPGQINLNLIIDEEVFFGLIDDARLNNSPFAPPSPEMNPQDYLPRVVTQVDYQGLPTFTVLDATAVPPLIARSGSHNITNRGFTDINGSLMKWAWVDFLRLRHGSSGFLFAHGTGAVGSANLGQEMLWGAAAPAFSGVAMERPFHSASYPDINYTVARPAAPPPSVYTTPPVTAEPIPLAGPVFDPGLKNPNFAKGRMSSPGDLNPANANDKVYPTRAFADRTFWAQPSIPPRRLFQIPDNASTPVSNSGMKGDTFNNNTITVPTLSDPDQAANLIAPSIIGGTTNYLGSRRPGQEDRTQHPLFRSELLQKVMNLSTVRTNQFAVWVTVGFFEVVKQGDATQLIPDTLGPELGLSSGKNARFRGFFIVDRSKAAGYNPYDPADFRPLVTFRRRIE